ncbi:hypothetical protein V1514DRAFT_362388 [Lipomyces japonicus]|uniref:uncharacterized protein n=1 Tax=Lipomyces japonicus TaxID=56871 RepID=UPI0034CDD38C
MSVSSSSPDIYRSTGGGGGGGGGSGSSSSSHQKSSSTIGSVLKTITKGLKNSYSNASSPSDRFSPTWNIRDERHQISGIHVDTLFAKLSAESSNTDRIEAAELFAQALRQTVLAKRSVEIWYAAQDMLSSSNEYDVRVTALKLLHACILYDSDEDLAALNKLVYYRALVEHPVGEEFDYQLAAFQALTKNGRELPVLGPLESPFVLIVSTWLRWIFRDVVKVRAAAKEQGSKWMTDESIGFAIEKTLHKLCAYIVNVFKFNYYAFDDKDIVEVLTYILNICRRTSRKKDIMEAIALINALTVYGNLPLNMLEASVQTLCGASVMIPEYSSQCQDAINHLINSHLANSTIVSLYNILRDPETRLSLSTIKGSIIFLRQFLEYEPEKSKTYYLTLNSVMRSYHTVMDIRQNLEVDLAVCKSIRSLLANQEVYSLITYEDYKSPDSPLVVLSTSVRRACLPNDASQAQLLSSEIMTNTMAVVHHIDTLYKEGEFNGPEEELIKFFLKISPYVDEEIALKVVEYYEKEYLCFPSTGSWKENLEDLLEAFYKTQWRSPVLRLRVLSIMKSVYWIAKEICDQEDVDEFIDSIFQAALVESDMNVFAAVIDFGVAISSTVHIERFQRLVKTFRSCMFAHNQATNQKKKANGESDWPTSLNNNRKITKSPSIDSLNQSSGRPTTRRQRSNTITSQSSVPIISDYPENKAAQIVTRAFGIMFIRSVDLDGERPAILYKELLSIATKSSSSWDRETIIIAYRILFRIRVNQAFRVILLHPADMDGLADTLHRTRQTMDQESLKEALWSYPEDDSVLGAPLPIRASYYLTACGNDNKAQLEEGCWAENEKPVDEYFINRQTGIGCINMSPWFSHIIKVIRDGADWETYSFLMAHLPPQLCNILIFINSINEIQMLRSLFCEQISGKLAQSIIPRGVNKADVLVAIVRCMCALLGYHDTFSKSEEDNIVKSVLVGLMSWEKVAATCVHCLLVCCYECPISIKKFLSQIFTNFQTKITNPNLSIHILDFLTALARIPSLITNFTQDDFKRVFAMAFKYIEHANDLSRAQTSASASGGNKVLSRYLIALAYSVVSSWFLTMRMADRRDLAPFIIRGLSLANSRRNSSNSVTGDVVSSLTGQMMPSDERKWAEIDLISRFIFSDVDLKMHTVFSGISTDKTKAIGNIWIHGFSIVSIETFIQSGISKVVVRRPTGTTSFNVFPDRRVLPNWADPDKLYENEFENRRKTGPVIPVDSISPDDQLGFLPEYFFKELLAVTDDQLHIPSPRVIKNPSDPAIVRGISMFDRTPVVEFHKIGIIYIGLNQFSEIDILSNSVGSRAYLDFLDGMGKLIRLKGNKQVYTGGLDTEMDTDGEFSYAFADKITQAIFHCTTLMPSRRKNDSDEELFVGSPNQPVYDDESLSNKKRHIGNNYVNIYWNESGRPFNFDTIKSQFNFINIAVSPHTRAPSTFQGSSSAMASSLARNSHGLATEYFKVRVYTAASVNASEFFSLPASHLKVIGKKSLPLFVRNLAFNADIFASVWHSRPDDEYLSNWQYRLRQVRNLRDRVTAAEHDTKS